MRLSELSVSNFRCLRDTGPLTLNALQALIGENNSGKSSLLRSIDVLTSAGAGGVGVEDFRDPAAPIVIRGVFKELGPEESSVWRPYLVNGVLTLEKTLTIETSAKTGKDSVKSEYHGYKSEPKLDFLSIEKIEAAGGKPKWDELITANSLPEYFRVDGKANKTTYSAGLARYLAETTVEYDVPDVSTTQALGLQSRVVATLPATYLLKADADYTSEVDRRSTTTTFRRLMGDLAERAVQTDPRYQEAQAALEKIHAIFNGDPADGSVRLPALAKIEESLTDLMGTLMPSVNRLSLSVTTDPLGDVFSRGVEIRIDDGVDTEVVAKGHGMQRCVLFTLLRALILNERALLLSADTREEDAASPVTYRSIILLVEEPELFIHPQLCKLFFDTLSAFAEADQVVYTTHSPLLVDAARYESVSLVAKDSAAAGTRVVNCDVSCFADMTEKKLFQGMTLLNPAVNEMFFARAVLLVEGPEDLIAVTAALKNSGRIRKRIEELGMTAIVAGGKQSMPFFLRVLNAFGIRYAVLHDTDAPSDATQVKTNATILALAGAARTFTFPVKLEDTLGVPYGHLKEGLSPV